MALGGGVGLMVAASTFGNIWLNPSTSRLIDSPSQLIELLRNTLQAPLVFVADRWRTWSTKKSNNRLASVWRWTTSRWRGRSQRFPGQIRGYESIKLESIRKGESAGGGAGERGRRGHPDRCHLFRSQAHPP